MYKYEVGQIVESLKGRQEGAMFDMTDVGGDLLILFDGPTKEEIEDIKKGKLRFGLFVSDNVIFLLSKFGNLSWMDSPFHARLAKNLTKLEEISGEKRYTCNITLVDSLTGKVRGLRYVSFSPVFSKKLREYILKQAEEDFDKREYGKKVMKLMTNYTTKDMVKFSEVQCVVK